MAEDALNAAKKNGTSSLNGILIDDDKDLNLPLANQDSHMEVGIHLDGAAQEELEAKKILSKRARRVGKIEDMQVDIEALFAKKKRFKHDDLSTDTGPV